MGIRFPDASELLLIRLIIKPGNDGSGDCKIFLAHRNGDAIKYKLMILRICWVKIFINREFLYDCMPPLPLKPLNTHSKQ